jgi:alanyl-tRNA synthetase
MKANDIREKFIKFFEDKGHLKMPSSPLVPQNDDTLLFANAGMNQFKDYFTGKIKPENKKAVTIQKVVRAGGKHNDLENVGFTARHHTFFEMLGNFSFGDYFKEDAITYAWEFLTVELMIPKEKLLVTVHYSDDDALKIWNEKVGIPIDRVFKKGDKDNFWEMGELGPCGPCSEIFFDHGEAFATPGFTPNKDQDILDDENRYVEIWNLVFMQYEKTAEGRIDLPKPSIDTGAGLERIAVALQGKYWNYDSDIFGPILNSIAELTGKKYSDKKYEGPFRVIADHIRSCTMLITDGVIPSNEGRGYVLRRIIRRAIRNLKELGAPPCSFYKLIPSVFESLGKQYPQNAVNASLAEEFLKLEEEKFLETLDQGLKFLKDAIKKEVMNNVFSGEAAFKLYDTYGFPFDLTEVILREKGIELDTKGFDQALTRQKELSKKSWKGGQGIDLSLFHTEKEAHGATEFLGYTNLECEAKLLSKIDLDDGKSALIFNKTSFYGESGGQAGDQGEIWEGDHKLITVYDTQKPVEDLFVHFSKDAETLKVGSTYSLKVSSKKRKLTTRSHSATHLLQAALIEVLGSHVKQAGSHVDSQRLRFDFTHMKGLTSDELSRIEEIVNEKVSSELEVTATQMNMDQAIEAGALALFGEKYGDDVRVLRMGSFSTELCGGTHVENTRDIGLFTITSEASLSSGVRRIEAVTSENAMNRLISRSSTLEEIERTVKSKGKDLTSRVVSLLQEVKDKSKEIQKLNDKIQSSQSQNLFEKTLEIKGFQYLFLKAPKGSDLRKMSDSFVGKYPNGIITAVLENGLKTTVLIRKGKEVNNFNCSDSLKAILQLINGRGGGKPDMAQGSGETGTDLATLDKKVQELI